MRSDGTFDYQQLERPAVLRKQASLVKSHVHTPQAQSSPLRTQQQVPQTASPAEAAMPDADYLDIPAFLRRQEECVD